MERPKTIPKEVEEYVLHLERRLHQYDTQKTLARFYLGIKKQIDGISKLMIDVTIDESSLRDREDKFIDRISKFQEKAKPLAETLVYLRETLDPETIKQVEQEDGSIYEQLLRDAKS